MAINSFFADGARWRASSTGAVQMSSVMVATIRTQPMVRLRHRAREAARSVGAISASTRIWPLDEGMTKA